LSYCNGKRITAISENLQNKEHDDEKFIGKFTEMCCRCFRNLLCEKQNVKPGRLGKTGGGGLSGIRIEKQTVNIVHTLNSFPKTSYNVSALHHSALH
jgi:hypothetical protein